eukprot:626379-Rhodomonas_salina.1
MFAEHAEKLCRMKKLYKRHKEELNGKVRWRRASGDDGGGRAGRAGGRVCGEVIGWMRMVAMVMRTVVADGMDTQPTWSGAPHFTDTTPSSTRATRRCCTGRAKATSLLS